MTLDEYNYVISIAKKKYRGRNALFGSVSIFSPQDLAHSFFESRKYKEGDPIGFIKTDFIEYVSEVIRDAKRRREIATIITDSDNFVLDNFDGNYRRDDLIEGYMYRNSSLKERAHYELHDTLKDKYGRIDYNLMLEDMHKVMLADSRVMCIRNNETGRAYWAGDPLKVPLERLYHAAEMVAKGEA